MAASAYLNDPAIAGCYVVDHPFHRDHRESYIVICERLLELSEDLPCFGEPSEGCWDG